MVEEEKDDGNDNQLDDYEDVNNHHDALIQYDDNQNLIAIAKMATPIKKTAERDFTFKIKLDI